MKWLLVLPVLLGGLAQVGPQEKRAPVPEDAQVKDAEKTIRELFKEDYAKKAPSDLRSLSSKLLAQSRESAAFPASRYALLGQALDLATQVAAVDDAMIALSELTTVFEVDLVRVRTTALGSLAKTVKTPEDWKALARAYLLLVEDAFLADDFDAAAKGAAGAVTQARRAKEVTILASAEAKSKEVASRRTRFEKVREARELLVSMPDDPAANLALGQYLCFSKGDWAGGLVRLSKSPAGALKTLAEHDLASPSIPEEQATVGDGWWDLSETAPAEDKVILRDRAGYWYVQSLKALTGLSKVKIEKRLVTWNNERVARGTWIPLADPAQFGQKGKVGDPIEINHTTKGTATAVNSRPFPPGDYDGFTMRIRLKMEEPLLFLGYKGPSFSAPCPLVLSPKGRTIQIPGLKGLGTIPAQIVPIAPAEEYVVSMISSKGDDTVYVNGVEAGHYPSPGGTFDSIYMHCVFGTTTIDKVKVRRR